MSNVKESKLKQWTPSDKDFSHFKRFSKSYGATAPEFPVTLGRVKRAILDQGETDECTAYQGAVRAGYRFGEDFSHKYQGAKEGEIAGTSIIDGTDPRTALAVPNTFGALPLSLEPASVANMTPEQYLDWKQWPLNLDPFAAKQMEIGYNLIDGPYDAFDNIRAALQQAFDENEVVLVFSSWYQEFNDAKDGIFPIPTTSPIANHASLFIDWENVNNEPMLTNHLSQGVNYADQGFGHWNRALVNWMAENGNMGCYIFRLHPQQSTIMQAIAQLDQEAIDFIQRIFAANASAGSIMPPSAQALYNAAKESLNKHMTLNDAVAAETGCAEAVSAVLKIVGVDTGTLGIAGTSTLDQFLSTSPRFLKIPQPEPGCIIDSPTGEGNGTIEGHTGIIGEYNANFPDDYGIMSNDSASGKFLELWSYKRWIAYYQQAGGLPVNLYRFLG